MPKQKRQLMLDAGGFTDFDADLPEASSPGGVDLSGFQEGLHHTVWLPLRQSEAVDREVELVQAEKAARRQREQKEQVEAARIVLQQEQEQGQAIKQKAGLGSLPSWLTRPGGDIRPTVSADLLHSLYCLDDLEQARAAATRRSDKDEGERHYTSHLYEFLDAVGGHRRFAVPPCDGHDQLAALQDEMPNFARVIGYVRTEFNLAALTHHAPRLSPILLDGPPGVGKTMFAKRLADILASGFLSISMETAQTASALAGSEDYWSNSKPGTFFTLMIEGEFANPVVLLDEIDKVCANGHDPRAPLYGLLEPLSARRWHDLAVPMLRLDVSTVNWILTSNDSQQISRPLLSRMKLFNIPPLTVTQARTAAQRIFAQTVHALTVEFDPDLPITMAAVLAGVSPREMHRHARELIATALMHQRRHLVQADLNALDLDPYALNAWGAVSAQIVAAESKQGGMTRH